MRYKTKTRDCRLIVRAKTSFGESVDEKALDAFSRVFLRGFLRAKLIKKNVVEYSGPIGISLHERLREPISGRDFLFIMEQFVLVFQKIAGNNLQLRHLVLDLQNVYINDVTKEVQFLYVPLEKGSGVADITGFVENVVYSAIPMEQKDADVLSRFIHFVKAQGTFSPDAVEKYIAKEDRSVVNTIKRQNVGQSGFMTSKQKHYYDHYEERGREADNVEAEPEVRSVPADPQRREPDPENTTRTTLADPGAAHIASGRAAAGVPEEAATGLLDEEATGLLDEEATGLLEESDTGLLEESATGLLEESATGLLEESDTGLLEEAATGLLDETATGLSEENETSLLEENKTGQVEDAGTMLLQQQSQIIFPTLFRVLTEETISVNKRVFRLGKEKSYVDYFVSNNNAVSRSHADIITRGDKYFVIDLNSKNHTYINDQIIAILCETEIRNGDRLRLGNEEFLFQVKGKAKSPMYVCPQCGKQMDHKVNFCSRCGARME